MSTPMEFCDRMGKDTSATLRVVMAADRMATEISSNRGPRTAYWAAVKELRASLRALPGEKNDE